MKTFITAVLLSLGGGMAFAQPPGTVSDLQVGYVRETFKMRDLQASPMVYVANLNGGRLAYTRQATRNQWRVGLEAGLADFVAPALGVRPIKFTPEQETPLWLVPTLYRGKLELEYRRRIDQTAHRSSWLGLGLHETVGYADGLALGTWALNTASASLLYQTRLTIGRKHTLLVDATLPLVAAVSRMPYSNVVSEPNRSQAASFFGGTRLATVDRFLHPQLAVSYRFGLSSRLALNAGYRYGWMRYSEPQVIRTAAHALNLSAVYKFQWQSR